MYKEELQAVFGPEGALRPEAAPPHTRSLTHTGASRVNRPQRRRRADSSRMRPAPHCARPARPQRASVGERPSARVELLPPAAGAAPPPLPPPTPPSSPPAME